MAPQPPQRSERPGGPVALLEESRTPGAPAQLWRFETLGCIRVALKTDGRNVRSQEAIARLGAAREGVLRRHMRVKGYQRDTVYYSILDDEWPAVKARLEARLGQPERQPSG